MRLENVKAVFNCPHCRLEMRATLPLPRKLEELEFLCPSCKYIYNLSYCFSPTEFGVEAALHVNGERKNTMRLEVFQCQTES